MIKNDDEYFPLYILDAHTFLLSRAPVLDLNLKTMYPNKLSNYTVTKKWRGKQSKFLIRFLISRELFHHSAF